MPTIADPIRVLVALACLGAAAPLVAQDPAAAAPSSQPLRVFLDCGRCDFDHLRREVRFVDYVRDRTDAQLHVLVTSQGTGGGGEEYELFFLGQNEFANRVDTLRYVSRQDDTEDETREGLTRTFSLGLIPYASRTGIADALRISYEAGDEDDEAARAVPENDPWDFWVFRARLGGTLEGESRQQDSDLEGSFSASRTTEALKIDVSASGNWNEERFELSNGEELISTTRDYDIDASVVWSVATHWSAGFQVSAGAETRVNQDLTIRTAPAIEYSVYPYEESTRRQITVTYSVGPIRYDYEEITLFDRLEETLVEQELELSAAFQQPWGEFDVSLEGSTFLHDLSKHRLDLFTGLEIRLFRGLNLDLNGNIARIKNQLYVPREDVSDEDILLERRQLGTDFEYEVDIGFSYTFGSVFNNIVNPRMSEGDRNFF